MGTPPEELRALPKSVQDRVNLLRGGAEFQFELTRRILEANVRDLFVVDFVFIGCIQRSRALIEAFTFLVERWNYLGAIPLVRMQLDSAMRLNACWLVEDSSVVADAIMKGTPLSRVKSPDGQRLTDRYLVDQLDSREPGVSKLYTVTSGYVHLSTGHVVSAFKNVSAQGREVSMVIGGFREWKEEEMLEAVDAFIFVTQVLHRLCDEWGENRRVKGSGASSTPAG